MRLDDFDPNNVDIDDQRGRSGSMGGGFPMPMGGGGRIGCGTLILILIAAVVFKIDPTQLLGGMESANVGAPAPQVPAANPGTAAESCAVDEASRQSCNALSSLNSTWTKILAEEGGQLQRPILHFYSQMGQSGCGAAQSAMGPFYCPSDNGIYLDTDFFRVMDKELGATGQFARLYVIAHEYGHHIQNVLGISDQVRRLQSQNPGAANRLSVRLELQADCFAGLWAARNKDRLEPGDMESGLNAASQIGDDTLMKNAGRRVSEESFTHGSSAQRMEWLRRGHQGSGIKDCDTFADLRG